MTKLIVLSAVLGLYPGCGTRRHVCYFELERNEAASCNRALLGSLLRVQDGIEDPEYSYYTAYVCHLAEQKRKDCEAIPAFLPTIGL